MENYLAVIASELIGLLAIPAGRRIGDQVDHLVPGHDFESRLILVSIWMVLQQVSLNLLLVLRPLRAELALERLGVFERRDFLN